jgi:hypothetical protein
MPNVSTTFAEHVLTFHKIALIYESKKLIPEWTIKAERDQNNIAK